VQQYFSHNFGYEYPISAYDPNSESFVWPAHHSLRVTLGVPHIEVKICCFPFQNPNFRFFFSFYGNLSFIVEEVILSPICAIFLVADLFSSIFRFIKVIRVLLFLVIFSYNSLACGRFSTFLIIDISSKI
jgi:hypothetical protein